MLAFVFEVFLRLGFGHWFCVQVTSKLSQSVREHFVLLIEVSMHQITVNPGGISLFLTLKSHLFSAHGRKFNAKSVNWKQTSNDLLKQINTRWKLLQRLTS